MNELSYELITAPIKLQSINIQINIITFTLTCKNISIYLLYTKALSNSWQEHTLISPATILLFNCAPQLLFFLSAISYNIVRHTNSSKFWIRHKNHVKAISKKWKTLPYGFFNAKFYLPPVENVSLKLPFLANLDRPLNEIVCIQNQSHQNTHSLSHQSKNQSKIYKESINYNGSPVLSAHHRQISSTIDLTKGSIAPKFLYLVLRACLQVYPKRSRPKK